MPIGGGGLTDSIPRLRQAWEDAGRDPGALEVVPYAVRPSEGKLAYFAAQGVRETVVQLPPAGETEVLRVYHLDRGFERLEEKLSACGATIERISG